MSRTKFGLLAVFCCFVGLSLADYPDQAKRDDDARRIIETNKTDTKGQIQDRIKAVTAIRQKAETDANLIINGWPIGGMPAPPDLNSREMIWDFVNGEIYAGSSEHVRAVMLKTSLDMNHFDAGKKGKWTAQWQREWDVFAAKVTLRAAEIEATNPYPDQPGKK